jgi:phage baseplate assembly protein gpV
MKKITTLFTALIVACSMTAFAAEKAAEVTPADATTAQTDVKKADGKKMAHHRKHHRNHYQGEVTAVDAKAGTVTVSRGEKTFTADEKILSGVKVGDKVSVKFTEKDGKLTATGIKPAKAHHMKKDVKAAEEKKAEEKK